jgi:hypothetical protein
VTIGVEIDAEQQTNTAPTMPATATSLIRSETENSEKRELIFSKAGIPFNHPKGEIQRAHGVTHAWGHHARTHEGHHAPRTGEVIHALG